LDSGLILISAVLALTSPPFASLSNAIDSRSTRLFNSPLAGRGLRLVFQWAVNTGLLALLAAAAITNERELAAMGGLVVGALIVTFASQGFQYVGQSASRVGLGTPTGNVVIALALSCMLNALAVTGSPAARSIVMLFSLGCTAVLLIGQGLQAARPRRG
jgi:hypothetical protein